MSPAEHYEEGYKRGLREGKAEPGEQDFAYKQNDYVRGYWDGYRAGRQEKLK